MLSLPANFATNLKSSGSLEIVYLIKITRTLIASPYTASAFYFSDQYFEITDGSLVPVRGTLLNDPGITQSIDLKNHVASIGGFNIVLADDGLSDDLATYNIYNQAIKIYIGDTSLASVTAISGIGVYQLIYTGIVKDFDVNSGIVTINIENSTGTVQKLLPQNYLTPDDDTYSAQPPEVKNMLAPLIYGDHYFFYGNNAGDTALTNIANVHKQENNLSKAAFMGIDATGDHIYLVSSHALHTQDSDNYKTWMYDSSLNRYVQIHDSDVVYSTDANGYVIAKISNLPRVYDFWFPDGTISGQVDPSGIWSDEVDSCDKDWGTYSLSEYNNEAGAINAKYSVDFPAYDGYQDDSDIIAVELYGKVDYESSDATDFLFVINGTDCESFDDSQLNNIDTCPATKVGVSEAAEIWHDCNGATLEYSTVKIYMMYKVIQYRLTQMLPVFVACRGRAADATLAGWFDDLSDGDLIQHPVHVIGSLLYSELGLSSSDVDTDSFNNVYDDITSGYLMAFTVYDQINSKDLIDKISKESTIVTFWNADNKPSVDEISNIDSTNRILKPNEIKGIPKIYKTKLSDIINDLVLKYNKEDRTGNYQSILERIDDRAGIGSQAVYNAVMNEVIESDLISDDWSAMLYANYLSKNDADSFWSVDHNIVEFETVDLRGINFWDGATFKPLMALELLDVIELSSDFDDIVKLFGTTWASKTFKIFHIKRNKMTLQIKAIEI